MTSPMSISASPNGMPRAVKGLLKTAGRAPETVDFICLHGQTVWHAPAPRSFPGPEGKLPVKGTLQIGSPAVLRERTGIPVIADLRSRDMAAGGEGAPLAQYIDAFLFGTPNEGRIVQNIGGIGNATVLPGGLRAGGSLGLRYRSRQYAHRCRRRRGLRRSPKV